VILLEVGYRGNGGIGGMEVIGEWRYRGNGGIGEWRYRGNGGYRGMEV
jgi:hypothetical protein